MLNTKKILAAALAATMVFGSSISAFADGPLGTGNTSGAGASEGHVKKELINVILPTIPNGSTPFAYTMDPERLIQETAAAKYAEGTVFPDKETDKGVYFLTAENTYANTSNTLQELKQSSCAITLTVDVIAENVEDKTNIALDSQANVAAATGTPKLYLGLAVGSDKQAVSTTKATVTKNIAGVPENFKIAVDDSDAYVYQEKEDATTWKAMNISMEGEVTKLALPDDDEVVAPTVKVTWSYDKAADDATLSEDVVDFSDTPAEAAPSIAVTSYNLVADTALNINVNLGAGDLAATSVVGLKNGTQTIPADAWSYSNGVLTITAARVNVLVNAGVTRDYTVVFDDAAKTAINVTLNGSGN